MKVSVYLLKKKGKVIDLQVFEDAVEALTHFHSEMSKLGIDRASWQSPNGELDCELWINRNTWRKGTPCQTPDYVYGFTKG